MRAIFLALILAAMTPAAVFARTPTTITKAEARAWPEARVKRQVMGQLSDILTEERPKRARPPVRPLTDMTFMTQARGAMAPGLCQIDRLTVEFRPRETKHSDEDTPASASGFRATRYYHFLTPPTALLRQEDEPRPPSDEACAKPKFWEDEFFTADDVMDATAGYLLARRVMDAIIAGAPPFAVVCDKYVTEAQLECADVMRKIKAEGVSSIERCEANQPLDPSAYCYRVDIGDRFLRIVTSGYGSTTVLRAELNSSQIIMWHERID